MLPGMPRFLLPLLAGCASTYAYAFHTDTPIDDDDVRAAVVIDATSQAVQLELTNKTDEVLQVDWTAIALTRATGTPAPLHPIADLGWIAPGATQTAELFPLVLPRHDPVALADDGRRFQLQLPVIVRREPKTYRITLTARVREI